MKLFCSRPNNNQRNDGSSQLERERERERGGGERENFIEIKNMMIHVQIKITMKDYVD